MAGPWEKYAKTAQAQEPEVDGPWTKYRAPAVPDERKTEAAIEGFAKGVPIVGSYLPQLQAAASKLVPNPNAGLDQSLRAQGFTIDQPQDTYVGSRDAFIKRSEGLQEQHPNVYLAGQVAGTVAGSAIPAKVLPAIPGVGKAFAEPSKRILGRLAQGAGAAGTVGFLENPGDVEGKLTDSLDERIQNAKTGAKYGIAAQLAGEAISKGAKTLAERAGTASQGYALKAAGANKGDIKRALTKGNASNLAKAALDETVDLADDATGKVVRQRLIEPGDSIEDVANKVGALKEQTGQKIAKVYDDVASEVSNPSFANKLDPAKRALIESTEFKPQAFAEELKGKIGSELKGKAGGTAALSRVQGVLDDLAANGETSGIKEMHAFRQSVDDLINYDRSLSDLPIATQKLKGIRDFINNKIKDRLEAFDQAVGGTKATELKQANSTYHKVAELDRMAKGGLAGEQSRAYLGLLDRQGAMGGAALGVASGMASDDPSSSVPRALAYGVGGALASRAARRYGPAAMANVARSAANAFSEAPGLSKEAMYMARREPGVLGAIGGKAGATATNLAAPPEEKPNSAPVDPQLGVAPKGEDLWAQKGAAKLEISRELSTQLLQTPQGKRLLIEASALAPGSRAMQRIKDQIQKGLGQDDSLTGNSSEVLRRKREPARGR